ncbi:hypothetical protein [Nonomuraea sp. B5E05]|uniref:hypothetical protein n=1 Tax=Nonomuraea sp. B5E05 TaxID=3153569 RepID=UPI00326069CF
MFVTGPHGAPDGTLEGRELEGPFVLPRRGLVREAADRWLRARLPWRPEVVAEPEGHEALPFLII